MILLIVIFLIRLAGLFPWTAEHLIYYEPPQKADLTVVLEGEYNSRVEYAFSLVKQGYADTIYSPGFDPQERKIKHVKGLLRDISTPIQLYADIGAASTYEEAIRTGEFAKRHSIGSILLVTSNYHSYRSWWIFRKVLRGVEVISTPLPEEKNWFSPEKVKRGSFAYHIYRKEQFKFIAYYLLYGWRLYL